MDWCTDIIAWCLFPGKDVPTKVLQRIMAAQEENPQLIDSVRDLQAVAMEVLDIVTFEEWLESRGYDPLTPELRKKIGLLFEATVLKLRTMPPGK